MKFGKQLRGIVECSYPEWQPNFLSYKELKKRIVPRDDMSESTAAETEDFDPVVTATTTVSAENSRNNDVPIYMNGVVPASKLADSAGFFSFLQTEVDKVNDFFLEKQEDYIIEHGQLVARTKELLIPGSATRNEVNRLRQRLIDFHAQLVILENYSTVNYTGFRKILKKHDKKTGLNLRSTALRNLSSTPFFLSDIARRLLFSTEQKITELDQIRKFRRANSAVDLPGLPAIPSPCTMPNPLFGHMSLAPLRPAQAAVTSEGSVSVGTDKDSNDNNNNSNNNGDNNEPTSMNEHGNQDEATQEAKVPMPKTDIASRPALLRLYRDCVEFSRLSQASNGTIPPPQSLIDLVDSLDASALGLSDEFVSSLNESYDYCLAADERLSLGFFVLRAGTTVQLFNFERPGSVVSRIVRGTAELRVYRPVPDENEMLGNRPKIAPSFTFNSPQYVAGYCSDIMSLMMARILIRARMFV